MTISLQQINVGNTANDGTGDTLRDSFQIINENFSILETVGGISGIANGTSSVSIPTVDGAIAISSGATANVVVINATGANVSGTFAANSISATANVTAGNVQGTTRMIIPVASSDPAGGVTGQLYYNSSLTALRIFNGSTWSSV